jgi:hypothetical protein
MDKFCELCERSRAGAIVGTYDVRNVCCCARAVIAARPSKRVQDGVLEHVATVMHVETPGRELILEGVKTWHD